MKFPKACKLHLAAGTDISRARLHHVHFDKLLGHCAATDGKIVAVVRVEAAESDEPGLIDVGAIKAACAVRGRDPKVILERNGETVVYDPHRSSRMTFPHPEPVQYPDYSQVIPEAGAGAVKLGLDVAILGRLAAALGTTQLQLEFTPEANGTVKAAIRVEGIDVQHGFGAIMPIA